MQYPSEDLYGEDMTWQRFCVLLSGLDERTPLGKIVLIRSETDRDVIDNFTTSQRAIYNDWKTKQAERQAQRQPQGIPDGEQLKKQMAELQSMMASFS